MLMSFQFICSVFGLFLITILSQGSAMICVASETQLGHLMQRLKSLAPHQQRAVTAVVGASVADAATRPMHWLYDRKKLEETVGDADPAFWPESISPFYTLPTGARSCYNDMSYAMLRALPLTGRKPITQFYDDETKQAYIESLQDLFSPTSEYALAMARRLEAYDPAKRLEDRKPVPGPWQQSAVTHFLKKSATGIDMIDGNPESKETDGLCSTIPLIAKLSSAIVENKEKTNNNDNDDNDILFFNQVENGANILSSNAYAMKRVLISATILRNAIMKGTINTIDCDEIHKIVNTRELLEVSTIAASSTTAMEATELEKELLQVKDALMSLINQQGEHKSYTDYAEKFGKACGYPGSFMGSTLALSLAAAAATTTLSSSSSSSSFVGDGSYADIIRKVMKVGGCNCSRANFVGACLGAVYGIQETATTTTNDDKSIVNNNKGIPMEWILKTDKGLEIFELALDRVV